MLQREQQRDGLTLVELLVVIAIIAFLMALAALYFPRFQEHEMVNRGADMLQGWLLMAKQQAKRDGLPTGLRLTVNGNTAVEMSYIQQPDDSAVGLYTGPQSGQTDVATFAAPSGGTMDFTASNPPVQAGDYLEVFGGGGVYRITQVASATTLKVDRALPSLSTAPTSNTGEQGNPRTNYRIIRQPDTLPGEQPLKFPEGVGIDLKTGYSKDIPKRNSQYEILFAPSGALIGENTTNNQVIFWVCDIRRDNSSDIFVGKPTLITVQPRTGFIANQAVSSKANDPYEFTRDTRSSGM